MIQNHLIYLICIGTLILSNAPTLHAQTEPVDTASFSTTLQEIFVEAKETLKTGNKDMYYPSEQLRKSMSTSSQLLAGLQIPDLIVNPATGDIAISGGGNLSIRINGKPASQTDLLALSAKDIAKVEFISNPGVRFGDVAGVLDVTVKRKTMVTVSC